MDCASAEPVIVTCRSMAEQTEINAVRETGTPLIPIACFTLDPFLENVELDDDNRMR
jgi:hypothetical protein